MDIENVLPIYTAEEIQPLLSTGNKYLLGIQKSEYFDDFAFVWYITGAQHEYVENGKPLINSIGYIKTFESAREIYKALNIDITKLQYPARWLTRRRIKRKFYPIFKVLPETHMLKYVETTEFPTYMKMRLYVEDDVQRVHDFYTKTYTNILIKNNTLQAKTEVKRDEKLNKIYKYYLSNPISS